MGEKTDCTMAIMIGLFQAFTAVPGEILLHSHLWFPGTIFKALAHEKGGYPGQIGFVFCKFVIEMARHSTA